MKCTLVGSRYFGAEALKALLKDAVEFLRVVVPAEDDRLALAARAASIDVAVLADPKVVPGEAIPEGTDLIVAAHTHARVSPEALARSRLGGVGYHPSLLPRHRGIAAVEWTVLLGDPIAGGSVYHLADGWDRGAIAAQDWCFVAKGETARELWERALAPMGLALLAKVVRHARDHGSVPAFAQDERYATRAPLIRPRLTLVDKGKAPTRALVATVVGPDRPGIVKEIAACAQGLGANWAGSRMSNLSGQFAGIVHFEVPPDNVDTLVAGLRKLQTPDLRVLIAHGTGTADAAGQRLVRLDLAGPDRPGIVHELSERVARLGVSIEDLHTEIEDTPVPGEHVFHVRAQMLVPAQVTDVALREALGPLLREMSIDFPA